jgi:hypothetical protein
MTKRTMLLVLVVEERESDFPTYDVADDEPSRIVQAAPKLPRLAKCGSELLELARKAGAL